MLKDCLEVFKRHYEQKGEGYILDDYVLVDGTYLYIGQDGQVKYRLEVNKKQDIDRTDNVYHMFCKLDYYCKLVDMNKALGVKKVIHSNNYLSFFMKKDNLTSGKLTEEVIDKYYEFLENPLTKYGKDKKWQALYEKFEVENGQPDKEMIHKNKEWIKEHIGHLFEEYPDIPNDKNYLKIFFEADENIYKREYNRYYIPNIYNATEYNVTMQNEIASMPNNNIGLNGKKPYLKHRTRKNSTPYLVNVDEVLLQKKFFDFLMNKVNQGYANIYIDEDIHCLLPSETIQRRFSGYFLRIQKGKEVEIQDFDTILSFEEKINTCVIPKTIEIDYEKLKRETEIRQSVITQLSELKRLINQVFFSKWLDNSYFREASDIKLTDNILKQNILYSRDAFFTWFYKGDETQIRPIFPKVTLDIIKNTICNGHRVKAQEQWMVRHGVIQYLNRGGETEMDQMKGQLEILEKKINESETQAIANDTEYAIAAGQLVNFFFSLNKASSPKHSLLNPILNTKGDDKLKLELRKLFKKYNYAIERRGKRFSNLYAMIEAYVPEGEISQEALIYGYLTNSLIYKKGDKENE